MDSRLDQESGLSFLLTEISSGLSFARIAREASPDDSGKTERNRRNARTAYETVLKFRNRVRLSDSASKKLETHLEELRSSLRQLGESL